LCRPTATLNTYRKGCTSVGLRLNSITGIEGRVELSGYKAVIGMFLKWHLERRGEDGSGEPIWTLRASLSFQKDSMLLGSMKKKVFIKHPQFGTYEVLLLPESKLEIQHETQLIINGVTLCRVEAPQLAK
jgi:hypothetical protein